MSAFWCEFAGRSSACIEVAHGAGEDAARAAAEAATGATVIRIDHLPYPAEPRLNTIDHKWDGQVIHMPSLCFAPTKCRGKSACPQRYSCSE